MNVVLKCEINRSKWTQNLAVLINSLQRQRTKRDWSKNAAMSLSVHYVNI